MPAAMSAWLVRMKSVNAPGEPVKRPSGYRERNATADRALDILGLFEPGRLKITGSDVAIELGVARSTAYRYLSTLGSAGYLEEDPTGGFRLGLKVFELARIARTAYGLSQIALPTLRELAESTGETALLTRRSRNRIVCLERESPSTYRARVTYERGSILPLNAGASALVLLAWEEAQTVRALLADEPLERFTESTLTSEEDIVAVLAEIRRRGYAISRGQLDQDVVGIAAPIIDDQGRVIAGLSLVAMRSRVPVELEAQLCLIVQDAARHLSEKVALVSH